ncbi:MAG: hypothetical protein U0359_00485 [Byssovorax sp.]
MPPLTRALPLIAGLALLPGAARAELSPWCAPELEALPGEACAYVPKAASTGPRTLVYFLHGVAVPGRDYQWNKQRALSRAAERHGFTLVAPRGRRGIGPKGMKDWWTWPTSMTSQQAVEAQIVDEWAAIRAELERRAGKPFERVYVFGFSSGGYYGASLALRDRLPGVDGYALFAGGSGADHLARAGAKAARRAPIYLGWGEGDPQHDHQEALARVLGKLGWPALSRGVPRVGHAMTDAQVDEALAFLGQAR